MSDSTESLLTALENERRYVARELHDGVAQTALQLGLQVGICRKLLERDKRAMLTQELMTLEAQIRQTASQLREFIQDMRPPNLEPEADLKAYLEEVIETHTERSGPPVTFKFEVENGEVGLTTKARLALARIVQESLRNSRKHAGAEKIQLTVSVEAKQLQVTITDDGHGFDPAEVETRSTEKGGAGLANLQARAEALGGSLTIASHPTQPGATVTVTLPKK